MQKEYFIIKEAERIILIMDQIYDIVWHKGYGREILFPRRTLSQQTRR